MRIEILEKNIKKLEASLYNSYVDKFKPAEKKENWIDDVREKVAGTVDLQKAMTSQEIKTLLEEKGEPKTYMRADLERLDILKQLKNLIHESINKPVASEEKTIHDDEIVLREQVNKHIAKFLKVDANTGFKELLETNSDLVAMAFAPPRNKLKIELEAYLKNRQFLGKVEKQKIPQPLQFLATSFNAVKEHTPLQTEKKKTIAVGKMIKAIDNEIKAEENKAKGKNESIEKVEFDKNDIDALRDKNLGDIVKKYESKEKNYNANKKDKKQKDITIIPTAFKAAEDYYYPKQKVQSDLLKRPT